MNPASCASSGTKAANEKIPEMALAPFLDIFGCPLCKSRLAWTGFTLRCSRCGKTYAMLSDTIPVLLPDDDLAYEAEGAARNTKMQVRDQFALIDRGLPEPYGSFATFLNLGYVPDSTPRHAVRGPARPAFNRYSTDLLFEVIGECDLDGQVVLDLGTGRGGCTAQIARYFHPAAIVGLDLSPANIQFCHARHTIACGIFAVGDVEYLPFQNLSADRVLNLESSHYYPNVRRFFDEVFRVLRRSGDFLYADILPAETFHACEQYLARLGFQFLRSQDISSNVLLACAEVDRIRRANQGTGLYDAFLVVPGSREYAALQAGETRYKTYWLRKG
jgi:SAM-dependent methyltransferase